MKLSIITINYNNATGLDRTITSIQNQTYSDFEYLVIDGNSTDESIGIIKKYSDKINYWISEPDSGVYNAMNKGIKEASGDYVLFINSGDCLFNDTVLEDIFKHDFDQDIVYGDLHRIYPDGHDDFVYTPQYITIKHMIEATLPHPVSLIRRSLFEKYGFYREDLKIVSDWFFFLKVFAFTNVTQKHISVIISSFYMDGLSSTLSYVVEKERYECIQSSFSPTLNYMCMNFDLYERFYNKDIFVKIRKAKILLKKAFVGRNWLNFLYEKRLNFLLFLLSKNIRYSKKHTDSIPIVIINYNRLEDLEIMIKWFQDRGHKKIVIVDNASTYPPLLEFYDRIKNDVTIEFMDENYGHMVFWHRESLRNKYGKGFYVVTDSDVIPNSNLPKDYLSKMIQLLEQKKNISKVGFALDLDNIPSFFKHKEKVVQWERQFWTKQIEKDVFLAETDTTFAIYHPYFDYKSRADFLKAIRIAGDFTATHKGWFIDSDNLTEELKYYYKTSSSSNSWKLNEDGSLIGEVAYLKKDD